MSEFEGRHLTWFLRIGAVLAIWSSLLPGQVVSAPADYAVAGGRFFSQTGRGDGSGYLVVDGGSVSGSTIRFWSEFQRLGGLDTLGYPISRRFIGAAGFTYQAFQRGLLQWRPDGDTAVLANAFEWLQQTGRDEWLDSRGVPRPIANDGSSGDWQKARQVRMGWLTESRIKQQYLSTPSRSFTAWSEDAAIQLHGLPMSRPEKRGPFVIQRFQRTALQLWVEATPGMPAIGTVVPVLSGDLLKDAGLIPTDALAPEGVSGATAAGIKDVRGVYLSYGASGQEGYRKRIFDLAAATPVNAVVIDAKSDRGHMTYPSDVPAARATGAAGKPRVQRAGDAIAPFKARGMYIIARFVVFKDDVLATAHPEWAVLDAATGRPWRDQRGQLWADPFREEVWDYNIALAAEAARQGFDEIQFDYIRFPGGTANGATRYARPNTMANRVAAINGFLERARAALEPTGVKLSADLFGYTAWSKDDLGIGQRIEDMSRYLDVVSPMLYPSSFQNGVPGYRPGVAYPYEVVLGSVKAASARVNGLPIRPWLQDFADYAYDRRPYTAKEVAAQISGASAGGAAGWMLWNAEIRYTQDALTPK